MIETIEKELESQFTDLLSIVSDDASDDRTTGHYTTGAPDHSNDDLDAVNLQLNAEIDEKLKSIELAKEELDAELKKRDSLIEFEKLDKNGYFSEGDALIDRLSFFDRPSDAPYQKMNGCETIEEKDENSTEDDAIDAKLASLGQLTDLNDPKELSEFFNLSRTNLNSVLEEDENEDSSQADDLIGLDDIENDLNEELSRLENAAKLLGDQPAVQLNKELNNNHSSNNRELTDQDTLPADSKKRNSCLSSNRDSSIINDSSSFTTRTSLSSLNTSHHTSFNTTNHSIGQHDSTYNTLTTNSSTLNSTATSNSTSVLSSIPSSIPSSMTRNESVINLESLNTETNVLVNNIFKKGVLSVWQASKLPNKGLSSSASTNSLKSNAKRLFFSIGTNKLRSWKSRYFMLTENYLLCFKKGSKSDFMSRMGKYQFKLNLLDDVQSIELKENGTHRKSRCIDLNEGAMYLYDKDFDLLKEWYDLIFKTRQRCEMMRQEQEIKFRREKQGERNLQIKEILSDRIERRKLVPDDGAKKRENLLDKFSEKYLVDKSLNSSSGKLSERKSEDDGAFEYLNNLRQRLSGATSVNELNRSVSNLAQVQKTNTPIISNRKRMSLQRKSLLSQFSDSFLGSPLSRSSSKPQLSQHSNLDNIVNLTNLANLTASAADPNWNANQSNKQLLECTESPTMLPRLAPQCQGNQPNGPANGQLNRQSKQLTNSCSVFHFATNSSVHSPFTLNNSPALTQRSLYAERILSNSSLTLSNLSKFPNRHSTLSTGTSFSNSLFKPFRESIHYATSLRKDNPEGKSHLKSATSEFSFIRLNNQQHASSNSSTLTKTQTDDDTLKRNKNAFNRSNFNRMHSFANDCSDYLDSEQDLSNSISDYNSDTLRNELRNSKTITNLNSELSKRMHILNPTDLGLAGHHRPENGQQRILTNTAVNGQQLIVGQMNNRHNYQKIKKKINNSLDESDSTFSSSNSSSSNSSNNYNLLMNSRNSAQTNGQRRPAKSLDPVEHLRQEIRSYSPKLAESPTPSSHPVRPISDSFIGSPLLSSHPSTTDSPLLNQRKKNPSKSSNPTDKEHTYQKVNSKRPAKQSANGKSCSSVQGKTTAANRSTPSLANNKLANGSKPTKKKANGSLIPVSDHSYGRLNEPIYEPIYQTTEKRKPRMNRILENQSKIYVTMGDLK